MNNKIEKAEKVSKITQSLVKDESQVLNILEEQISAWQEKVETSVRELKTKFDKIQDEGGSMLGKDSKTLDCAVFADLFKQVQELNSKKKKRSKSDLATQSAGGSKDAKKSKAGTRKASAV